MFPHERVQHSQASCMGQFSSVIQFSSIQFKMVYMRSGRPTCAPPRLSGVSPHVAVETVPMALSRTLEEDR